MLIIGKIQNNFSLVSFSTRNAPETSKPGEGRVKDPITLMLYFKSLSTNDVGHFLKMLTLMFVFKPLVINVVDLVDLCTRIYTLQSRLSFNTSMATL